MFFVDYILCSITANKHLFQHVNFTSASRSYAVHL